ncbi:MAG TPA: RES domain-containing protein [Frankiaceae bacterium]|nr:RES domain-containing protein [Frankiaceae bacterium]
MSGPATVAAPGRVWRIGRGSEPLTVRRCEPADATSPRCGKRFDSSTGDYDVLYFGTTLEACFGETLARLRPSIDVIALVREEWEQRGFMAVGAVPADWRTRRTAVAVTFGDVEHPDTHTFLRRELALGLSALGYRDLDVGVLRGSDRRVTQLVSEWVYRRVDGSGAQRYAGIRYLSRVCSDWECWAVLGDVELVPLELKPITLDVPELQRVAKQFELQVF